MTKDQLFNQHYNEINKIVNKYCFFAYSLSPQDREDLCQEILIKVYKAIDKFDNTKCKLSTYIITISKNALLDFSKRAKASKRIQKNNVTSFDICLFDSDTNLHDLVGKCDAIFDDSTLLNKKIENVLVTFKNDNYRKIFGLYFINELKYDEIVTELNIPLNTVKSTINRLRTILSQELISFKNGY